MHTENMAGTLIRFKIQGGLIMVRDMTQGNVTRHLLTYAVPLMFANLLQQLYQTVDSIIVGQYNGKALAAIGAAGAYHEYSYFPDCGPISGRFYSDVRVLWRKRL